MYSYSYVQRSHAISIRVSLPFILFLFTCTFADAQLIPVWKTVDTTLNRHYIQAGIDYAGPESIVVLSNGMGIDRLVYRSSDGGETWNEIFSIPFGTSQAWFKAIANPVDDVIAVAGDSSEFITYDEFLNPKNKYWGTLTVSRDRGATWEHHILDSNTRLIDISMCDATHGIASLQNIGNVNNEAPNSLPDLLLYTDNAWQTWQSIPLPAGFTYVPDAICLSPTTFLASGYDVTLSTSVMRRTTDQGKTWMPVEGFRQELTRFTFLDSLNGWGAGGVGTGIGDTRTDLVARTTDGGATWTTLLNDGIGELKLGIEGIDFADKLNGIAVGGGNKILRTTDGGLTWIPEFPPSDLVFSSLTLIASPKPDLAVAFSVFGPIIRYSGEEKLIAPSFIKPENSGPLQVDSVLIEWTAVEGAVRYRVEVTPDPIGDGLPSDEPPLPPIVDSVLEGRSLVVRDLLYWHRYFVRVKAIGPSSESDWSFYNGSALFYTVEKGSVLPPAILTPPENAVNVPTDVVVSWHSVPGAISYDLQIGYDHYFLSGFTVDEKGLADTAFRVSWLTPSTSYYLRVRANLAAGVTDWTSRYAPYIFKTDGAADVPEPKEKAQELRGSILLSPNPASDILKVEVRRVTAGNHPHTIALYNQQGKLLRTIQVKETPDYTALSVGDLPAGRYFIQAEDGGGIIASQTFTVVR